jgi:hypothetical protein
VVASLASLASTRTGLTARKAVVLGPTTKDDATRDARQASSAKKNIETNLMGGCDLELWNPLRFNFSQQVQKKEQSLLSIAIVEHRYQTVND